MDLFSFEDKLEIIGLLGGLLVVIIGVGSLLSPPFSTNESTGAAVIQTIGILATIVVGALLIAIARTGSEDGSSASGS